MQAEPSPAAKVLVVASEPITADRLRRALGSGGAPRIEVLVVAPALHTSGLRFWLSDADEAIERARGVAAATVDELSAEEGIQARGDTGEGDPLDALADVLATFPADRVLLFTRPQDEQRYRESIDSGELHKRFGVAVELVAA